VRFTRLLLIACAVISVVGLIGTAYNVGRIVRTNKCLTYMEDIAAQVERLR